MRVGIYDRWLATLGGGERMVAAIAESYQVDHDVEILTHVEVDCAKLARWFGCNLDRVRIKVLPDSADFASVRNATKRFDVFFNASHLDLFHPAAKRNILVVYFPAKTIQRAAALGVYNRAKSRLLRGLTGILGQGAPSRVQALFSRGGTQSSDQTPIGHAILATLEFLTARHSQDDILGSYDSIFGVSDYTQEWIHRYWHLDSQVLYPPVDASGIPDSGKRHQILSVGRFFAGSHNKKQHVLIRAFRENRAGPLRDWELHLAGGFTPTESNCAYLEGVRDAIDGDPSIHLHLNCEKDALRKLYAESALFWHATGFGEDPNVHPERFEHFGITTLEAMAAGEVPLVYAGGGQPEIVTSGQDGMLWTTLDELIQKSADLALDEPKRAAMAITAAKRATDFDLDHFRARLTGLVGLPDPSHDTG